LLLRQARRTESSSESEALSLKKQAITKAQIERAMKAANECGQPVRQIIMTPDEVRFIFDEGVDDEDSPIQADAPKPWPRSAL